MKRGNRLALAVLLLAGATAISIAADGGDVCTVVDDGPWAEVKEMISGDQVAEGLKKAAEMAKTNPRDKRMREVLKFVGDAGDAKAWRAARAAAGEILTVLRQAFEKAPDVETAMNFVVVADSLVRNHFVKAADRELRTGMYNVKHWDKGTSELYVELAKFYRLTKLYDWALNLLSQALTLTGKGEKGRYSRLDIAEQQAEVVLARDGKHSVLAVPYLQRVVQLDTDFESLSNRALCKLGSIALAHGDVGLAKTYLSLAGRVNLDPVLRSFGYERGLAFELIDAGYADSAIEYLKIAYKNEPRPKAETILGLGRGYFKKGDEAEARKWFRKYLTFNYKPAEAFVRNLLHRIEGDQAKQPETKQ